MKKTGKIMTAHCTCMAGISQTCNHVAAALFHIEAAVRIGLSSPSCTSKACEWLPNNKKVEPLKVKEMKLGQGKFGRNGKKSKELMSSPKKRYDPAAQITDSLTLSEIIDAIKPIANENESIIFSAEYKRLCSKSKNAKEAVPTIESIKTASTDADTFHANLNCIVKEIDAIEKATRGQNENPLWFSVRRHAITASKAHEIKTRMTTASRLGVGNTSFENIFSKMAGNKGPCADLPALKFGRSMEAEAVESFTEMFSKSHKNVRVTECGIFFLHEMPFLGGSPDRIISCDCCGNSCLEVKCPYSILHTTPNDPDGKLPYLNYDTDNELRLNRAHKYYTQCQIQMAATKISKCHFFVWTSHGFHSETINFDESLWEKNKAAFQSFYWHIYVPHLFK